MRISDWSSDVCSSDLATHADVAAGCDNPGRRATGAPYRAPSRRSMLMKTLLIVAFLILILWNLEAGLYYMLVDQGRSEERRVGNECVRTCRYRGVPDH